MAQTIKELPVLKYWRILDCWLKERYGQEPSTGKEMEQSYKRYPGHPFLGASEIFESRNTSKDK